MDAQQLRELQAPIKTKYREQPEAAVVNLSSTGQLVVDDLVCRVASVRGSVEAGLHPAAGGDGSGACSGDMVLDALVACAGVTLGAVATAMGISIHEGKITAEGEMDFRGTLGIAKNVPIGLTKVRLHFDLATDAPADQIAKLIDLTERYCVVYQSLVNPPAIETTHSTNADSNL